jgi:hypothetical protein
MMKANKCPRCRILLAERNEAIVAQARNGVRAGALLRRCRFLRRSRASIAGHNTRLKKKLAALEARKGK